MSDLNYHLHSLPLSFIFPKLEKIASKYCYGESDVIDLRKLKFRSKIKLQQKNHSVLKKKRLNMTIKKPKIQKKCRKTLQK